MSNRDGTPVPTPQQVRYMSGCSEETAQTVSTKIAEMAEGDRPVTLSQVQAVVKSVDGGRANNG